MKLSFSIVRFQAYESRGLLALGEGDTQLAIQDFTTAIRLGADGGLVHYNRAVALSMTGDLVNAAQEYQLACERNVFQACSQAIHSTAGPQLL